MKKIIIIFCTVLTFLQATAQNQISHFLNDLSIRDFRLNTSLGEIQANKRLNKDLSFVGKEDNISNYVLKNQKVNIFDLDTIDEMFLDFEDDHLKRVMFEIDGDLDDGLFNKAHELLRSKYGDAISLDVKNSLYNTYIWKEGDNEIILKPLKASFLITYGKKESKSQHWIYKERKGKGKGLVQLNVHNWEKLVNSKLTIDAFEKQLPGWETTGNNNHINFGINYKTGKLDIPQFVINYKLDNYNIEVTADTSSKIIADFEFFNIKNPNLISDIKKDMLKSNYKTDKDGEAIITFYYNDRKKTTIMVAKGNKGTSFKIYRL